MLSTAFVAAVALFSGGSVLLSAQRVEDVPVAPKSLRSLDTSFIDPSVNPCDDFYKYSCGNWTRQNPVPADQERVAVFLQMSDRDFYLLYLQLKEAATTPKTPPQKQYGTFYAACTDADQANRLGIKPLQPTLAAIDALGNKAQIANFLGNQDLLGAGFFSLTVT